MTRRRGEVGTIAEDASATEKTLPLHTEWDGKRNKSRWLRQSGFPLICSKKPLYYMQRKHMIPNRFVVVVLKKTTLSGSVSGKYDQSMLNTCKNCSVLLVYTTFKKSEKNKTNEQQQTSAKKPKDNIGYKQWERELCSFYISSNAES